MRYLQNSVSTVDSNPKQFSEFSLLAPLVSPRWNNSIPPQPHQLPLPHQGMFPPLTSATMPSQPHFPMPISPLPFGCLNSPRSPYPLLSPGLLLSPSSGQLGCSSRSRPQYRCQALDGELSEFFLQVKDALVQFEIALNLDPNPAEAQAALYNKACCHAYRGEGKKAADCLQTALREYDLKFGTILNDPDLASFRALPEFKEFQEEARLGGEDIGYSFRRDLKLISEVQAPFRGVRRFFYVALSAAAGISFFFTIPWLFRAIRGSDDAPDLWETAGNAAINIGAFCRYHCSGGTFFLGQQERGGTTCTDIPR